MRAFFWVFVALSFGLIALGALSPSPSSDVVFSDVLDGWFGRMTVWSVALGIVVGAVAFWRACRRLRHAPGKPGVVFLGEAAGRGVAAGIGALMLAAVMSAAFAYMNVEFSPLAPAERVQLILVEGLRRSSVVFGAASLAALSVFAITSRVRNWGARYALLGPTWFPDWGR